MHKQSTKGRWFHKIIHKRISTYNSLKGGNCNCTASLKLIRKKQENIKQSQVTFEQSNYKLTNFRERGSKVFCVPSDFTRTKMPRLHEMVICIILHTLSKVVSNSSLPRRIADEMLSRKRLPLAFSTASKYGTPLRFVCCRFLGWLP